MAKSLNLNKVKKQVFTLTLPDEDETVLLITTPTKTTLEEFIAIKDNMTAEEDEKALDAMYDIVAKIMSHNRNKIQVTPKMLEACMDFEDLILFVNSYTEFIREVTNQKN